MKGAIRGGFESFHQSLRETYLQVIRASLPPDPADPAPWKSVDRLAWIGLIEEQGKFYVSFSFGPLQEADELQQLNLSRPQFDYLESTRLNDESFPDSETHALIEAFEELLAEGLPDDIDLDEDEFDDARTGLRRLAASVSLGLLALELMETPALVPMPVPPDFSVNVSDDLETPTWPLRWRWVEFEDERARQLLLGRLCDSERSLRLFRALLDAGDWKPRGLSFLEALRGLR